MRLHHGVVDALRAAGQEGLGRGAHEAAAAHGLLFGRGHGLLAGGPDVVGVALQRGLQRGRAGQEDASVPQHVALQQQGLRGLGGGLLDEAGHAAAAVGARIALRDVAVGRAGEAGHHAEGDDGTGLRGGHALLHRVGEGHGVGDVVVGRTEQQQAAVVAIAQSLQRGKGHGGGGVARGRLQQQGAAVAARFDGVGHQEAVLVGRHAQGGLAAPGHAVQGKRE